MQRWGRSHGRGIPELALWPIKRSTPARRQRTAPDEISVLRFRPANQSLITDVFRLRLHPCTIIPTEHSSKKSRGGDTSRSKHLTKDIRAISGTRPQFLVPHVAFAHASYSLVRPRREYPRAGIDHTANQLPLTPPALRRCACPQTHVRVRRDKPQSCSPRGLGSGGG